MKKCLVLLGASIGIVLGLAIKAEAVDFSTAMGIATANMPPGADAVAIGNAHAATPVFSSNNPAIIVTYPGESGASLNWQKIDFEEGPELSSYIGSVYGELGDYGTFQVSYSDGYSNKRATSVGNLEFENLPFLDFQYGFTVFQEDDGSNKVTLGLRYAEYASELGISFRDFESLGGARVDVDSEADGYLIGGGIFYQPTEKLSFGYYYDEDHSDVEEEISFSGMSMKDEYDSEITRQRLGASYKLFSGTMLAVDYQHLDVNGEDVDQIFAGIEQKLGFEWLYGYAGYAGDAPTAGLGLYMPNGGLVVAYMDKAFEDLEDHLGEAKTATAILYVFF